MTRAQLKMVKHSWRSETIFISDVESSSVRLSRTWALTKAGCSNGGLGVWELIHIPGRYLSLLHQTLGRSLASSVGLLGMLVRLLDWEQPSWKSKLKAQGNREGSQSGRWQQGTDRLGGCQSTPSVHLIDFFSLPSWYFQTWLFSRHPLIPFTVT